jgi:SAM-dependent methyltransferase
MLWWYAVAERDHNIQNPTSPEKIRLLGERLRLGPESDVLDLACGKAGPALILAGEFGCRVTGVERAPVFASVARERVATAGLQDRIEIVECDAAELELEPERYDVGMCLGASFVWDGLDGTLAALAPAVRAGGHLVVGEPYWRRWPLPDGVDAEGFVPLNETVACFTAAGLQPDILIVSSEDDWDRYESLHWRALEDWLAANPDDPDAAEFRRRHELHRHEYLTRGRELLGWAIFAALKRKESAFLRRC